MDANGGFERESTPKMPKNRNSGSRNYIVKCVFSEKKKLSIGEFFVPDRLSSHTSIISGFPVFYKGLFFGGVQVYGCFRK